MFWKQSLLQLSLLVGSHATPSTTSNHARSKGEIKWGPCELDGTLPIECGSLSVPLDYTNRDSGETVDLQLLKVPASKEKKGSILFNFGGPGMGARSGLAGKAKTLQGILGGHHDLIAHDPRGTEKTLTFNCFKDDIERIGNLTQGRISELASPEDRMVLGRLWASTGQLSDTCRTYKESKKYGELIGTAFTARDLMEIVDAVEDDGLLRYWGFSYGTVLGATVAAMFPDRIDRIVIDGVSNAHEYYNSYDIDAWADTDAAFTSYLQDCVKSPDECALAGEGIRAPDLEKAVYNALDKLKYQPAVFAGQFIDHSFVKSLIRPSLYNPSRYANLSIALDALINGDIPKLVASSASLAAPWGSGSITEAPYGIPCSDKKTGKHSFDEVMPALQALSEETRLMEGVGNTVAMTCSQWKFQAKERYEGNFQVKTKHPMLVIGNTYDAATPLKSARNMTAGFEGSVLLEHGGSGHCSSQHGSVCTGNVIRKYFVDGELPLPGTLCMPAYSSFAAKTWDDIIPQIGKED
ncbi:hypothetical protein FQN51_009114 [Onygenales sp. PD_10]|nr:hypothetical protein FQN51_009114 [Onygenales sp. PD_10]